jgi:hypothetical protein
MGLEVFGGVGPGLGHVAVDAGTQGVDVIGKEATDQDNAVALEGVDVVGGEKRVGHGSSSPVRRLVGST